MINIVVLDGFTANPGDISWNKLSSIGNLKVYDRTSSELTVERTIDAEIVLTNKTVLDRKVIAQLPKLRYVGVLATGYNVVDCKAAAEFGIVVTNVPAYSTDSVAQTVFAHILNLAQNAGDHARAVADGEWCRCKDFSFHFGELVELRNKTLGILGFGAIGRKVAEIGSAFGMQVVVCSRTQSKISDAGYEAVTFDELLKRSDILSLNCPLTDDNAGIINAKSLAMMKTGAFLINTARGGLIDEQALADALNDGMLGGAGLDVLSSEPPDESNPLLNAKGCYITPHFAWATLEARCRLLDVAVDNVAQFIKGNSVNVVT
jgi:glycerate dehydrogenase